MTRKAITIVALIVLASLLVAGCTTTTPSTNTATPAPSASDVATRLNDAFTNQGIAITSQFTQTTNQYGNAVYSGVVKENDTGGAPSLHNITIEETTSRNDSYARFTAYVVQAQKAGYSQVTNMPGDWWGIIGQGGSISKAATISISAPDDPISLYRIQINVQHANYTVNVDYTTWP